MNRAIILSCFALMLSSACAVSRARTPDGKVFSCVGPYSPPIAEHEGFTKTMWDGHNHQYGCIQHTSPMPDIDGKANVALVAPTESPNAKVAANKP